MLLQLIDVLIKRETAKKVYLTNWSTDSSGKIKSVLSQSFLMGQVWRWLQHEWSVWCKIHMNGRVLNNIFMSGPVSDSGRVGSSSIILGWGLDQVKKKSAHVAHWSGHVHSCCNQLDTSGVTKVGPGGGSALPPDLSALPLELASSAKSFLEPYHPTDFSNLSPNTAKILVTPLLDTRVYSELWSRLIVQQFF
jgi:hypothetical protein